MKAEAEGYYFQAARRLREDIEVKVRYGEAVADKDDRDGRKFQRETFGAVPAHTRYSRVFAAGVRWDVSPKLMLRAEFQNHKGTFILSVRENPVPKEMRRSWNMFAVSASYRF